MRHGRLPAALRLLLQINKARLRGDRVGAEGLLSRLDDMDRTGRVSYDRTRNLPMAPPKKDGEK